MTALVLAVASIPPPVSANASDGFVYSPIHFEVPTTDLVPGLAVRASCDVNASGESLDLLANATARSTLALSAGPCAIVLVLLGTDVTLPLFDTTPLGKSSFYIPGISTLTLGIVDLSVDLVTSLNSTSGVADGTATITPAEIAWPAWGAQRISVHAADGIGSVVRSDLNTSFTFTMSVALSAYAVSVQVYHVDLKRLGSFPGRSSLVTGLSVDLRPHAVVLAAPTGVGSDRASFSWSGTVDSDVDHFELWLTDGEVNTFYRLPVTAMNADVLLRPGRQYQARLVTFDGGGQSTPSNVVAFDSPAAATPPAERPLEAQGNPALTWTLVALAILSGFVGFMLGWWRGRKTD